MPQHTHTHTYTYREGDTEWVEDTCTCTRTRAHTESVVKMIICKSLGKLYIHQYHYLNKIQYNSQVSMTLITIVKAKQLNNMEIILASKVPGIGCKARPHQMSFQWNTPVSLRVTMSSPAPFFSFAFAVLFCFVLRQGLCA